MLPPWEPLQEMLRPEEGYAPGAGSGPETRWGSSEEGGGRRMQEEPDARGLCPRPLTCAHLKGEDANPVIPHRSFTEQIRNLNLFMTCPDS